MGHACTDLDLTEGVGEVGEVLDETGALVDVGGMEEGDEGGFDVVV